MARIEGGAVNTELDAGEEAAPAAPAQAKTGEAKAAEPEKDHSEEFPEVESHLSKSGQMGWSDGHSFHDSHAASASHDAHTPAAGHAESSHAESSHAEPSHAAGSKAEAPSSHAAKEAAPEKKGKPLPAIASERIIDIGIDKEKAGSITARKQLVGDAKNGIQAEGGHGEARAHMGVSRSVDGSMAAEVRVEGRASAVHLTGQAETTFKLAPGGNGVSAARASGTVNVLTVEGEASAGFVRDAQGNNTVGFDFHVGAAVINAKCEATFDVMVDGEKLGTYGFSAEANLLAVGVTAKNHFGMDDSGNLITGNSDGAAAGVGLTLGAVTKTNTKVAGKIAAKDAVLHGGLPLTSGATAMKVVSGATHQMSEGLQQRSNEARARGDQGSADRYQTAADLAQMPADVAGLFGETLAALGGDPAPLNDFANFVRDELGLSSK